MNGHVFKTPSENNDPNQFTKMVEALVDYMNKTLKAMGDLNALYKNFKLPVIPCPEKPTNLDLDSSLTKSSTKG